MSTVTKEHDARVPATRTPAAPTHKVGRGRVVRIAFGSLALLAALALIGSAIAGIVGLETNRDATGYFVTHTHHYQTSSYALSTESLNVGGVTGALEAGLVRLRISATSNDATNVTCHQRFAIKRARSSVWPCSTRGASRCRTAGSRVMMSWAATPGFVTSCVSATNGMC